MEIKKIFFFRENLNNRKLYYSSWWFTLTGDSVSFILKFIARKFDEKVDGKIINLFYEKGVKK